MMELDDIVKILLFFAFFVLPPILKAVEDKKKKKTAVPRQRKTSGQSPKQGQTLSEWIEEVRKAAEEESPPARSERPEPIEAIPTPPPRLNEDVVPVRPHVNPVEVDIHAHVSPVKTRVQANVSPIESRFGSIDLREESEDEKAAAAPDSARRAKSAKRAKRETGRTIRARRAATRGQASITIRKKELKRAIMLTEVLSPPLALRDQELD